MKPLFVGAALASALATAVSAPSIAFQPFVYDMRSDLAANDISIDHVSRWPAPSYGGEIASASWRETAGLYEPFGVTSHPFRPHGPDLGLGPGRMRLALDSAEREASAAADKSASEGHTRGEGLSGQDAGTMFDMMGQPDPRRTPQLGSLVFAGYGRAERDEPGTRPGQLDSATKKTDGLWKGDDRVMGGHVGPDRTSIFDHFAPQERGQPDFRVGRSDAPTKVTDLLWDDDHGAPKFGKTDFVTQGKSGRTSPLKHRTADEPPHSATTTLSPVPLPPAALMLLSAFGLLGCMARRRKAG